MAGTFIVLEGPDGSGTTHHTKLLVQQLQNAGKEVVQTCEPTNGDIGAFTRSLLNEKRLPSPAATQLLFCADRAHHVATVIQPALDAGKTVVCDRYAYSTVAYGAAAGVDPEYLERVNAHFPTPDILVFALPPIDVCLERIARREQQDAFEVSDFQRRVYEEYVRLAKKYPNSIVLDTSGGLEEAAAELYGKVRKVG